MCSGVPTVSWLGTRPRWGTAEAGASSSSANGIFLLVGFCYVAPLILLHCVMASIYSIASEI